jgi:hypothetical protein
MLVALKENTFEYLCSQCTSDNNGFKYDDALERLNSAAKVDRATLKAAAEIELIFLRNTRPPKVQKKRDFQTDSVSADILARCNANGRRLRPAIVEGDGNCLFHALSLALYNDQDIAATELRVRVCIELAVNKGWYETTYALSDIAIVSPELADECMKTSRDGSYSSAWTIAAAASVIYREIRSVYPPINGVRDKTIMILDRSYHPRRPLPVKRKPPQVVIMWTSTLRPMKGRMWVPNHFVPLLEIDAGTVTQPVSYAKIVGSKRKLGFEVDPCVNPLEPPKRTGSSKRRKGGFVEADPSVDPTPKQFFVHGLGLPSPVKRDGSAAESLFWEGEQHSSNELSPISLTASSPIIEENVASIAPILSPTASLNEENQITSYQLC